MAKYTISEEQRKELYNIPWEVMGKMTSVQNCTFPTKSITDGIANELEPAEIADMAYESIIKNSIMRFDDIERGDLRNIAMFMSIAIQRKLEELVQDESEKQDIDDGSGDDGSDKENSEEQVPTA